MIARRSRRWYGSRTAVLLLAALSMAACGHGREAGPQPAAMRPDQPPDSELRAIRRELKELRRSVSALRHARRPGPPRRREGPRAAPEPAPSPALQDLCRDVLAEQPPAR